ncbi:MAG: hypothetical protein Q7S21_06655 [archaeon]|nr:hypothetical protein [archaeon]
MTNITISVSEDFKKKMDKFPELNWSAVARKAIGEKMELLEKMDKLLENSKFTEKDALEMGRKVRQGISKRFLELSEPQNHRKSALSKSNLKS